MSPWCLKHLRSGINAGVMLLKPDLQTLEQTLAEALWAYVDHVDHVVEAQSQHSKIANRIEKNIKESNKCK